MSAHTIAFLIELARDIRDAGLDPNKIIRVNLNYMPMTSQRPDMTPTALTQKETPPPSHQKRHKGKSKNDK